MNKLNKERDVFIEKFILGPLQSNSYIIASKKTKDACIIDPCQPTDLIKDTIKKFNFRLKCIINTHGHIDHIQGDCDFDVPVYIHKEDVEFLTDNVLNLSQHVVDCDYSPPKTKRLLKNSDMIKIGNVSLEVIHTPGHTPGSICLGYDNLVFTGDTLFFDGVGRCDLPHGSESKLISSIKEKLLILPDETQVLPGHGPETTIGRERRYNPFL